jgi:tripartite-type tricarboxylate transporter receptor subunit TctC
VRTLRILRTLRIFAIALVALVEAVGFSSQAKDYPEKPVRIIVPYPPGGAVDVMARIIAQKLSEGLGGQFYVENLAGAGGDIGTRTAARAAADGQSLLIVSPDFVVRPLVKSDAPYDPITSFAPVTLVASSPTMITVHSSVPAKTMKELIDLLRVNPGKYTLGTPGYGTVPHLAGERLYRQTYGVDVIHVPFQGFGPAVTSTIAGHTSILGAPVPLVAPYIKDGTLRALAIANGERSAAFPDVPTLAEAGIANQEVAFSGGVVAPAGTPKEIVDVLHRQIVAIVAMPDVREHLATLGFEPVASTPEEFRRWIKAEFVKWREVVRAH